MRDSLRYRLAIHKADTREQVLEAVQGYFSALAAAETAALPAPLREVTQWGVEDVMGAGMLLADAAVITIAHGANAEVLREASSVMTLAALRLSLLAMDEKRAMRVGVAR